MPEARSMNKNEAFERAMRGHYLITDINEVGRYNNDMTNAAQFGWQAAHTHLAEMLESEEMVDDLAHIITGAVAGTCCSRTGGKGGDDAHPNCDCRSTANAIISAIKQKLTKGE